MLGAFTARSSGCNRAGIANVGDRESLPSYRKSPGSVIDRLFLQWLYKLAISTLAAETFGLGSFSRATSAFFRASELPIPCRRRGKAGRISAHVPADYRALGGGLRSRSAYHVVVNRAHQLARTSRAATENPTLGARFSPRPINVAADDHAHPYVSSCLSLRLVHA